MEIKIEKGIPIPSRTRTGHLTETLRAMEVGDSITLPLETKYGLGTVFYRLKPKKFVRRTLDKLELRVWRIA